jgi:hypothetical protein
MSGSSCRHLRFFRTLIMFYQFHWQTYYFRYEIYNKQTSGYPAITSGYFILRRIRTPYIRIHLSFSPVLCGILHTVMNPGFKWRRRISRSLDVVTNSLRRTLVRDLAVRVALEFGRNLDKYFAQKICCQCVYDGLFIVSLIRPVHISLCCCPTAFPHSLRHNWSIYHTVGWASLLLGIENRDNWFHLAIILLSSWIRFRAGKKL